MDTILGLILGAIIVVAALAWSFRHPSPHTLRKESSHGWDGADVYGGWNSDHHTDQEGNRI